MKEIKETKAPPPLLQVKDLHICARAAAGTAADGQQLTQDITLVRGVSFQVAAGKVLGLIGESGAGKSTIGLAALLYGRGGCTIRGGEVLLDGVNLLSLPPPQKRALRGGTIAYVAQSAAAAFNPAYRIQSQILEVSRLHGGTSAEQARARMVSLFRQLGLPAPDTFGEKFPHQASGGQLQRAMTAMALCCRPKLVVFDEPTTALDVTTQLEVLAAIKKTIQEEQTAALYISHDLAVVAQMADDILVLRHGAPVEYAPAAQLLRAPREEYTAQLLAVRHARKPGGKNKTRALLKINNASVVYGGGQTRAVDSLSAEVTAGHTLAVVGESGSGKTTLARAICGLLPLQTGEILFNNAPLPLLSARSAEQTRRIQMVHQTPDTALNPRNTVREIITRPLILCAGDKAKAGGDANNNSSKENSASGLEDALQNLLRQVELPPALLSRYPPQLSGGQKQRVVIARALATNPSLIICDEPTSALDPLIAHGILKLLRRLQEERGVSYLFITHDISVVRAIADDIVVMHNGRAAAAGSRDDVLNPPHDDYTRQLLAAVPEMRPGWLEETLAARAAENTTAASAGNTAAAS